MADGEEVPVRSDEESMKEDEEQQQAMEDEGEQEEQGAGREAEAPASPAGDDGPGPVEDEDDDEEEEEEDYQVETVLKRRRKGDTFVYLIKWENFEDSDNTWETREDLVADGFEAKVDEYDREHPPRRRYTQTSRRRSKTPERAARSPAPRAEEAASADGAESEPETVAAEAHSPDALATPTDFETVVSATPEAIDSSRFLLSFLMRFFLSCTLSMSISTVKANLDTKQNEAANWLTIGSLLADAFPVAVCAHAILLHAPLSDFSNRSVAVVWWIVATLLCIVIEQLLQLTAESGNGPAMSGSTVTCMLLWQLIMLYALYASDKSAYNAAISDLSSSRRQQRGEEDTMILADGLSIVSYIVAAAVVYDQYLKQKHDAGAAAGFDWQWEMIATVASRMRIPLLQCLGFACVCRAMAKILASAILSRAGVPLAYVVEYVAACAGAAFIILQIDQMPGANRHSLISQKIPEVLVMTVDGNNVILPVAAVYRVLAWSASAGIMCSAIMYHGR
mmetsp:Transcript_15158/g.38236  ORF Transcript_15158/g.38236 Transcript_15158/m.38236 type:complete len:508 (+) Transcript_15158:33-1556(+)